MTGQNNEIAFLSKDAILTADDSKMEVVEVPEWGGKVNVCSMSAIDRDAFEQSMMVVKEEGEPERNMANFRAKLCALTICNANGKRMFTLAEATALGNKSAAAISRVADVAGRLNGIGKSNVEELTKNSAPGQIEG